MGKRKTNENFDSKKTIETSILEKLVAEAIVKVKADYQQEINSLRNELNVVRNNQELVTEQCKQNIDSLKQDVSILIEKTDHILGSLTYLADEYDDFNVKLTANSQVSQRNLINICELKKEVDYIICKQNVAEAQLDDLEQYGRRENLEIHGVPLKRDENTNEIVKSVVSSLNVRLDDHQISTSHRLASSYKKIQRSQATEQPPPIIVRFANRDKRNEIYKKRKLLKLNCKTELMSHNSSPNITIQENLTPLRKSIYKAAKQAKAALNYKFAWTSQGKIFLRQDTDTKVFKISSFHDLAKLGYSGAGEKISRF